MRKILLAVGLTAVVLCGALPAHALRAEYGKGDPKHPVSASFWPEGIKELANREDRFGGYFLNAHDEFWYRGDAKTLNAFLKKYAKAGGTRQFIVDNVGPVASSWTLSVSEGGTAVIVPLKGTIKLKDIQVPAEVEVGVFGDKTPEAEQLIREHDPRAAAKPKK